MAWDTFFDMGGYAAFVWPAFGLSTLVLIVMLVVSLRYLKTQTGLLEDLDTPQADR